MPVRGLNPMETNLLCSGFTPTTVMGLQTPCATLYSHSLTAPPVPESSLPTGGHIPVVQTISDYILAANTVLDRQKLRKSKNPCQSGKKSESPWVVASWESFSELL